MISQTPSCPVVQESDLLQAEEASTAQSQALEDLSSTHSGSSLQELLIPQERVKLICSGTCRVLTIDVVPSVVGPTRVVVRDSCCNCVQGNSQLGV